VLFILIDASSCQSFEALYVVAATLVEFAARPIRPRFDYIACFDLFLAKTERKWYFYTWHKGGFAVNRLPPG